LTHYILSEHSDPKPERRGSEKRAGRSRAHAEKRGSDEEEETSLDLPE
jgi:hypothetical protein